MVAASAVMTSAITTMRIRVTAIAGITYLGQSNASEAERSTEEVKAIWSNPVRRPTPHQREDDEDSAVGGVRTAEMDGLVGRNDPIQHQDLAPTGQALPLRHHCQTR